MNIYELELIFYGLCVFLIVFAVVLWFRTDPQQQARADLYCRLRSACTELSYTPNDVDIFLYQFRATACDELLTVVHQMEARASRYTNRRM